MSSGKQICTGCGDEVLGGRCCRNCRVGASKRGPKISDHTVERILALYWQDDRKPKAISEMLHIDVDYVRDICFRREPHERLQKMWN